MSNKLLIVGVTIESAGIGGVSIHLERLVDCLRRKEETFDFIDYKKASLFKLIVQILKHKVIHIHPSNPLFRLFLVSFSKVFGKKVIFTVHGDLGRFSRVKNYMDQLAIKWCDFPVLINKGSFDKAIGWNKRSQLISAYIPPVADGYIPEYVSELLAAARTDNKKIVCTNASARTFTSDGYEIYGIDFLIDYFSLHHEYYLCISDPSSKYSQIYKDRKFDNILFISENHSFYAVMKLSDVMVRATATDGDSLSIREALDLQVQVLATDCVDRPDGVVLFKYGDVRSFEEALLRPRILKDVEPGQVVDQLISLYNHLR